VRDNSRDRNTQLVKFLFKLNLASLYSPNLILRDILVIRFLSCGAHLSWTVVLTFFLSVLSLISCFECVITHLFECIVTLITDRLDNQFLCKGSSSTSVKLFFNILAQPQLLEVESPGDVGIFKPNSVTSCVLVWSFLFFSHISLIAIFLWELYSAIITVEH
jgi:hypothetical protein